MSLIDRSLICGGAAALCLALALAPPLAAQDLAPEPAPANPEFFPRFDFHLSAASLAIDDPRFSWDTHFGGDLDLVDYVKGRTSLVIDYEAVLGHQLRAFDPNQGNYTLEASSSWRIGPLEVDGMLHHVSRHLSDRPKTFAIAWNVLGARLLGQTAIRGTTIAATADLGWVQQRAYVDYTWVGHSDLRFSRPVSSRASVFLHGSGQVFGVTAASGRGSQAGGVVEAGVKLRGSGGALELFAGLERRVDADPIQFGPERWAMAGFRFLRR